jgi:hypothetical protein
MSSPKPGEAWRRKAIAGTKHRKTLKDADAVIKTEIAERHAQLRTDFLARDAVRFPDGWRLPKS